MSKPKPGDLLTYMADVERTGVVLDRAPSPMMTGHEALGCGTFIEVSKPADYRVWVHREDGTFDVVKVNTRTGKTDWIERRTAGGDYLRASEQVA